MIDYVSLELKCDYKNILSNQCFDFATIVSESTGEIKQRYGYTNRTAQIGNSLKIEVNTNKYNDVTIVYLKGSLHKYAHGDTNYTNYSFQQLTDTIQGLCNLLGVEPHNCILRHFEMGVNVMPYHPTKNLLNSIISCRGIEPEKREYNKTGYLKRFEFSQYVIKIYDKGKQYQLPNYLLRFEIKIIKMQYLHKKGIEVFTLNDLLQLNTYQSLERLLVMNIDSLYFYDYRINTKRIENVRERSTLIQCSNPVYWINYKSNHTPEAYKKKVKRFRELVLKHSPTDIQKEFKSKVLNKWNELQNCYPLLPHVQNTTVTQYYPYIVGNNSILYPKYCLTCGRDISSQKISSKFCSEKMHGKEVKKCRNKVSNFILRESRKYRSVLLFDIDMYLTPEYRRLKGLQND